MGFFSSRQTTQTPPLSQARVKKFFDSRGFRYWVGRDGSIAYLHNEGNLHFLTRGERDEVLCVFGTWSGSLPMDCLEQVREFIRNWHRTRLWPKCYHSIDDNGRIRIYTELNTDYESGVADEQLDLTIRCGLSTSILFFLKLTDEFLT